MEISVITTLFNERSSVDELVASLLSQTLSPAEIVVADAGSTDGTRQVLDDLARRHPVLRVIDQPGNRSAGRNAAIAATTTSHVATIDGGCVAEPNWLERLAEPLRAGEAWVAGFYRPEGPTLLSTCIGLVMVYVPEEVDDDFLPSARSMAFRRDLWAEVGGFPEELEFAEDTAFGERLRQAGYRPHPALEAVVRWRPPESLGVLARTAYRWGRGDGEAGLRGAVFRRLFRLWGLSAGGALVVLVLAPRLAPLALVPLAVQGARTTRPKYRWADGAAKYFFIPVAHLVATVAQLVGYAHGRLGRSEVGAPTARR